MFKEALRMIIVLYADLSHKKRHVKYQKNKPEAGRSMAVSLNSFDIAVS